MFDWLFNNKVERVNSTVVKTLQSKGSSKMAIPVTVVDIQNGIVIDAYGYQNEVVLFLRKNKKDR